MRAMPSLRLGSCLLAATALAGSVLAQSPRTMPITFDLTAVARDGSPVTNLQAADISVRVNGRVQTITSLTLVRRDDEPAAVLPAPYATNQAAPGRTIAVAVDVTRLPGSAMPAVNDIVTQLAGAMRPRDRASILSLVPGGFALDFTTRHARITAVGGALKGTAPVTPTPREAEAAVIASLGMLERVLTTLAAEPGLKTVVFVTAPFAASSDIRKAIDEVARAVAIQRVQLRIIDVGSAATASPAGLGALAAATGATVGSGIAPVAASYELTFTPSGELEAGKLHRVQIASIRPEVHVAGPASYVAPATGAGGIATLADMLRQPRVFRDLPLRLGVYPVQDADREHLRLLILGETLDPSRTLAWAEFALVAPNGAILSQWKVEGAEAAARPLFTASLVNEGAYRLRMAASELSGRRGTVDVEFDARLTPAGSFALSQIMFGAMSADAFVPQLQPPSSATAIMAYAELYGRPDPADTWAATFEIARTSDGAPISTTAGSVRTTPDPVRRAALATLELGALTPGDYTVRAIISRNGTEIGRMTRTLRRE
jgi:hypothetical protein